MIGQPIFDDDDDEIDTSQLGHDGNTCANNRKPSMGCKGMDCLNGLCNGPLD